jgi:hydroxyacylglutathione hydrolase
MSNMKIITLPMGTMGVNCYLLRDMTTGIGAVVDPGGDLPAYSSAQLILRKCAAEAIDIKYILITHAHFDHILSLEALREATGAQVCIHQYDTAALADPNLSYMAQFANITEPCEPAEVTLVDGDIITIGSSELEVIHTPGHTPGSICFKGDDFILTGDTLFRGSIGRCDLYGGDQAVMFQSLNKFKLIAEAKDYKIYPGHGQSTLLSRELRDNIFLK